MAGITCIAVHQKKQVWEQFTAVFRDLLNAFVSNRMRQAAAEAEHIRLRHSQDNRFDVPPPVQAEMPPVQFEPLDPSILSAAIPAFFIGRNRAGCWVAREAKGRIGGLFLLKSSALSFAHGQSAPTGCATIFPSVKFELDLGNDGNPFAFRLASLMRLATDLWQRIGKSRKQPCSV
jgi:hypothetical protein